MPSFVSSRWLAVLISTALVPLGAAAQMKVELGATVGHYAPLGSFQPAEAYSTALPLEPSALAGFALGGELRVWTARRIGIGLAGMSTSSSFGGGNSPAGYLPSTQARVSTATAEMLFRITGEGSRARVWIGAGGAAVKHGGTAYEKYGSPVNYGAAFGVGSAIRIAGPLSADLGVTTLVYGLDIDGSQIEHVFGLTERGTQVDAMFHTGLSVSWH